MYIRVCPRSPRRRRCLNGWTVDSFSGRHALAQLLGSLKKSNTIEWKYTVFENMIRNALSYFNKITSIWINISIYIYSMHRREIMGTKTYNMEPISVFFFFIKKFLAPVRTTTHERIRERVLPMIYDVFVTTCIILLYY